MGLHFRLSEGRPKSTDCGHTPMQKAGRKEGRKEGRIQEGRRKEEGREVDLQHRSTTSRTLLASHWGPNKSEILSNPEHEGPAAYSYGLH